MTIYLAGGITGDEDYKTQFAAAKRMLLRDGEDRLDSTAWYYGSPRADSSARKALAGRPALAGYPDPDKGEFL